MMKVHDPMTAATASAIRVESGAQPSVAHRYPEADVSGAFV